MSLFRCAGALLRGRPLNELPSTFNARAETVARSHCSTAFVAPLRHPGVELLRMAGSHGTTTSPPFLNVDRPRADVSCLIACPCSKTYPVWESICR